MFKFTTLDGSMFAKRTELAVQMDAKDYTAANSLIANWPTSTTDEQNYKYITNLGITVALDPEYTLNSSEISTLQTIVQTEELSASLARGLLYTQADIDMRETPVVFCATGSRGFVDPIGASAIDVAIDIYPNPFVDELKVIGLDSIYNHFKLYDVQGKLWYDQQINEEPEVIISTSDLPAGIYFYHLLGDGQNSISGKLIKL